MLNKFQVNIFAQCLCSKFSSIYKKKRTFTISVLTQSQCKYDDKYLNEIRLANILSFLK